MTTDPSLFSPGYLKHENILSALVFQLGLQVCPTIPGHFPMDFRNICVCAQVPAHPTAPVESKGSPGRSVPSFYLYVLAGVIRQGPLPAGHSWTLSAIFKGQTKAGTQTVQPAGWNAPPRAWQKIRCLWLQVLLWLHPRVLGWALPVPSTCPGGCPHG